MIAFEIVDHFNGELPCKIVFVYVCKCFASMRNSEVLSTAGLFCWPIHSQFFREISYQIALKSSRLVVRLILWFSLIFSDFSDEGLLAFIMCFYRRLTGRSCTFHMLFWKWEVKGQLRRAKMGVCPNRTLWLVNFLYV